MTPELKEFLLRNHELLENEQYYELYCFLGNTFGYKSPQYTRELSELIIECEGNPLEYLPSVPISYLNNSDVLEHIVIPDHIEMVRRAAFINSGLKTVSFNDTSKCTCIAGYAFEGCQKLEKVILPPACKDIFTNAFRSCPWLETVVIPTKDNHAYIDEGAFYDCPYLTIYCYADTYVENYCIDHNLNYKLIDKQGVKR